MSGAHLFYVHTLDDLAGGVGDLITIVDNELARRIARVLRLRPGDDFVVFNDRGRALALRLQSVSEAARFRDGHCCAEILNDQAHIRLPVKIKLYVGLTKKDAFEAIVYAAGQLGIVDIFPLITRRTHTVWLSDRDHDRLRNIGIAAAEQSKSCQIPDIHPARMLDARLLAEMKDLNMVLADPAGISLLTCTQELDPVDHRFVGLCVGPEGGFDDHELEALAQIGVVRVALTPTILRTQEAVFLAAAFIQSLSNN